MNKTKWIIFGVIIVAIFGGIIFLNRTNTPEFKGNPAKIITDAPIADHYTGPEDQKVVLIEYGDFQCPACSKIYPTVEELKAKYKGKLTFIFRNRPLTNIHPNALAASTVAEAAGLQGKFFPMYDLLYQNQSAWSSASTADRGAIFEGFASQLGLDLDKYRADLKSADIVTKIGRDRSTATTHGANSTPTFVLNGQKMSENDAVNPEALTKKIEEAIAQAYPTPAQ
ncbi:MAG TPA: thioredoxin domain-containing protein [Candidatus Saccharimonadales bacterium]|nr:thioredoxin domain-containing protein [Candidatus Saccharimonadales bacterium]